jgi:glycosyltransferase involved in cell wall biosynthesis
VSPYPPDFGGHGIQFQRSLPTFAARDVAATILTRRPVEGGVVPADPVPVYRTLAPGNARISKALRIWQFRRHFQRYGANYDLLHAMLSGWDLVANLRSVRRLGIPVIVEMVLLGGDDLVTVQKSRFGAAKLRVLREVDAWVGISKAFLPTLQAVGIPEDRFHLVYTGVDLERHRPRDAAARATLRQTLDIPAEARVVVSVGSVMPRKGMDRVLAAWRKLGPVPGSDLLVIVGPDRLENGLVPAAAKHAADMQRLAKEPELAGTVRFVGRVDNVEEYMAAADVFLFLSRREGLGTVILESLACGLPAIVSPLDGIGRELLVEGQTGFVTPDPDDADAVAHSLESLLDNRELRGSMSEAGRRTAIERFSMQARADALVELYRELHARA